MDNMIGSDGFLAEVGSQVSDEIWDITPLLIELDGQDHEDLKAMTRDGVQPSTGDIVFISTSRNNFDMESVSVFFNPSQANCMIVGIVRTTSGYFLKGDYSFEGDVTIDGDLSVTGELIVNGDAEISGISFLDHTHDGGDMMAGGDPVLGNSGTPE